jgi:hypothetical protein
MEAVRSSETFNFYRASRSHISEDGSLRNNSCENMKSNDGNES